MDKLLQEIEKGKDLKHEVERDHSKPALEPGEPQRPTARAGRAARGLRRRAIGAARLGARGGRARWPADRAASGCSAPRVVLTRVPTAQAWAWASGTRTRCSRASRRVRTARAGAAACTGHAVRACVDALRACVRACVRANTARVQAHARTVDYSRHPSPHCLAAPRKGNMLPLHLVTPPSQMCDARKIVRKQTGHKTAGQSVPKQQP